MTAVKFSHSSNILVIEVTFSVLKQDKFNVCSDEHCLNIAVSVVALDVSKPSKSIVVRLLQ